MTDFMATAGWGKSSCTQEYIDQRVSDLTSSLHAAAATHFGEKKGHLNARPWFDQEISALSP